MSSLDMAIIAVCAAMALLLVHLGMQLYQLVGPVCEVAASVPGI